MYALADALIFIDGEFKQADSGAMFDIINPWTGQVAGRAADAATSDASAAIASARHAFDATDWKHNHAYRLELMTRYAKLLREKRAELLQIARLEAGAAVGAGTRAHIDGALDGMDDLIRCFSRVVFEEQRPDRTVNGMLNVRTVRHEPLGVVAAITPWNVPLYVNVGKVGAALLAGCTVILKPAPDTPKMASFMAEVAAEAGLPAGVFNVLPSSDPALVGEQLVASPLVDCISFTGSTAVGKHIMRQGAATMKRVFLELGGKSVNIVLDDARDFTMAIASSMVVFHAGQGCAYPTRLLVPKSRYQEACAILQGAYAHFDSQWGDFEEPTCIMGPVISAKQRDRVMEYIRVGQEEGARLLTGGELRPDKGDGFFIAPTCFVDVDNTMRIAREEIFGPVLVVIPYEDDEDAIRIANDSDYGLGGMVTSGDEARAVRMAEQIEAGCISVNGGMSILGDLPFGGYKSSGIGREWGHEGIEEFLQTKAIAIARQG
ncbi:MAG: aldehyde dehydrogenase family protein [Halieaceae bacterium]|nr:aldehyde dehydrogenase family protein [Halieaceae bacterium]